jgi:alpha-beta hydrolase superfamily lysophospholipase
VQLGESDPVAGVLSLGTLLTALKQVLDAIPWRDLPLALAGNSFGAWMSMLYAQKCSMPRNTRSE